MADQTANDPRAASWRRDPTGRHYARYWDGQGWTEHVASAEKVRGVDPMPPLSPPAVPAPPDRLPDEGRPAAAGPSEEQRQGAYLLLGGAACVAVGCFLPWAKLTAPFLGTISKSGIEGDGVLFLGLAAIAAGVAFGFTRRVPGSIGQRRWTLAAVLAALAVLTVFEISDLTSRFADISDQEIPVSTSYGAGLWLVGIGVVLLASGWFRMPWAQLRRRDEAPAPKP